MINNFFHKIIRNKWAILIVVLFCVVSGLFINPVLAAGAGDVAAATTYGALGVVGTAVSIVLSVIAFIFTTVTGLLTTALVAVLIQVAQFNNIINVPTVQEGWVLVRDLVNMFFVLILLVIAFGTILRIENYNAKKMLPKLLIMAVLINFSRTIFGLLIDFSQVIMLTFVASFKNGGGLFMQMFRVDLFLSINANSAKGFAVTSWSTVVAIIAGSIASIITLIVIAIILGVLVIRIIMLWIYTILSPLVFLGFAFPPIQKYVGKIWEDFIKQLVVGPLLAFFLWLALTTAQNSSEILGSNTVIDPNSEVCVGIAKFFCQGNLQNFIIVIGLLIGGLMVTQEIGGAAGSMAGKGMAWAKGAGKFVGGATAYIPKQYAKRAGYGVADKTLEQMKKLPGIGGLAMKGQAKLKMKRDYAEEQDTRYMQYLSEKDLDLVMQRHRGKSGTGAITRASRVGAFVGRGMESGRSDFKRALTEKMKRGEEWGMTKDEKMENKTQAMIDLARMAGHSVTVSGEDTFRDAELGKLWNEYRNKNAGMIDDDQMRAYYKGGSGKRLGSGRDYNYKGLEGGDNSEYWRGPDPVTGELRSPDSMVAYTMNRIRMPEAFSLHHENYGPREVAGVEHFDAFEALYDDGNGSMKTLAQIRDRGTKRQKDEMRAWFTNRLHREQAPGHTGSTHFRDLFTAFNTDMHDRTGNNATEDEFFDAKLANGGIDNITLGTGPTATTVKDRIGRSRNIAGKSKSVEVASGITGLDKLEKRGQLALNFSEIGLDDAEGKYFDNNTGKEKIAKRIGNKVRASGMAEDVATAVEDQINKASYLILHNKEAGISGAERKTTIAHEKIHGKLGSTFSDDELKTVWNDKMNDDDRNRAREKVTKIYNNDKMSDDAVMHEYFAEGLTNKTRWREKAPEKRIGLSNNAEKGLDDLMKSKGSNIQAFTSNLPTERPTQENIKQSISSGVDSNLKGTMEELTSAIQGMGDGFSSLENVVGSMDNLDKSVRINYMTLEKNAKSYKDVSGKLSNLSNSASAGKDVSGRDVSSKLDNLSKSVSHGLKSSGKDVSSKLNKLSKDMSSDKDNSNKLDNLSDNENPEDIN